MTFSIVAHDPQDRSWGIAVASKFPAVGAVVPWARAGSGAVATQSFANTSFGPRGLEMMAGGASATETLARLLGDDPDRELRQVGLVDSLGNSETYTGAGCHSWAGGLSGKGYAIQGNILAGVKVIAAMEKKFLATNGDLPNRLVSALLAGDRAGGDRRGRQSAAVFVVKAGAGYGGHGDRWVDYRVDDHENPVPRLRDLLEMHELYFGKSPDSQRLVLKGKAFDEMSGMLKQQGYLKRSVSFQDAFGAFIGSENFEERADPHAQWIDKPVWKYLLKKFYRRRLP